MGVDELGVDKMGVDKWEVDEVGMERLADQGSPSLLQHVVSDEFSSLLFIVLKRDLFVYRDVTGIDELEGHHSNRTTN